MAEYVTDLLELYRIQRHDFLNHFQVAMGYLQMGKDKAALDYLRQAATEMMEAATLSRVEPAELAVELMCLARDCFNSGIELHFALPAQLPVVNWREEFKAKFAVIRCALLPKAKSVQMNLAAISGGVSLEFEFAGLQQEKIENVIRENSEMFLPAESGSSLIFNLV